MRKIKRARRAPTSEQHGRKAFKQVARASATEFNTTARGLMENLQIVFPGDPDVKRRLVELHIVDATSTEPAMRFFETMHESIDGSGSGSAATLADLVCARDDRLFGQSALANVLGPGLASRWGTLDADNKGAVWAYMQRMLESSSQAYVAETVQASNGIAPLIDAVDSAMRRGGGMGSGGRGSGRMAASLLDDPGVASAAEGVLRNIGMAADDIGDVVARAKEAASAAPSGPPQ